MCFSSPEAIAQNLSTEEGSSLRPGKFGLPAEASQKGGHFGYAPSGGLRAKPTQAGSNPPSETQPLSHGNLDALRTAASILPQVGFYSAYAR